MCVCLHGEGSLILFVAIYVLHDVKTRSFLHELSESMAEVRYYCQSPWQKSYKGRRVGKGREVSSAFLIWGVMPDITPLRLSTGIWRRAAAVTFWVCGPSTTPTANTPFVRNVLAKTSPSSSKWSEHGANHLNARLRRALSRK